MFTKERSAEETVDKIGCRRDNRRGWTKKVFF
uniref:Uncharacterized protein n=1 Tax=Rhizophora mucronata TaxID=61149 RepID=A0A2P2PXC2_RHIMU